MNSHPDVKIIQPSGILDSLKGTKFREEVTNLIDNKAKIILVDFQDVTFMDSSGLGALVLALKTVRASGAKIFICAINDQVKMLFELTSMDKVFQIFPNRQEFINQLDSIAIPNPDKST
ncbi:STAS domain-containing protein [Aerosakkonemataceae cyanobacterium BLCC-F154]|uniref:Anti-sigma factor antagonist n=1 Tax=Floridaenema fluviatile BLCC-F154 TaxID=3153640 RepID=A0ABV4YAS4_9CYAN